MLRNVRYMIQISFFIVAFLGLALIAASAPGIGSPAAWLSSCIPATPWLCLCGAGKNWSFLGLLLLGMALVPLAPCLPAWKPQALETWLNAAGTAILVSSTPDAA